MEKMMKKIAGTQTFSPEDNLGRMIRGYEKQELSEESLDLVYAARKEDASYADFLKLAKERDRRNK